MRTQRSFAQALQVKAIGLYRPLPFMAGEGIALRGADLLQRLNSVGAVPAQAQADAGAGKLPVRRVVVAGNVMTGSAAAALQRRVRR
jgi:hypothetical protein